MRIPQYNGNDSTQLYNKTIRQNSQEWYPCQILYEKIIRYSCQARRINKFNILNGQYHTGICFVTDHQWNIEDLAGVPNDGHITLDNLAPWCGRIIEPQGAVGGHTLKQEPRNLEPSLYGHCDAHKQGIKCLLCGI